MDSSNLWFDIGRKNNIQLTASIYIIYITNIYIFQDIDIYIHTYISQIFVKM